MPPPPVQATVRHILLPDEAACAAVKLQLEEDPGQFGELAQRHSTCPSGQSGGALGTFGRGAMVPAFDAAVFDEAEVGAVHGCVQTEFGFHVLMVDERSVGAGT